MSSNVPDRAAKELYYKPFAAAVDAGVGSAMCSYVRAPSWGGGVASLLSPTLTQPFNSPPLAEPREWHLGLRGRKLAQ